jgi:hypothetical protein
MFFILLDYPVRMILFMSFDNLTWLCWCFVFLKKNFIDFFLGFIILQFDSWCLMIIIFLVLFLLCRLVDFLRSLKYNDSTLASFFYVAKKLIQLTAKYRSSI